MSGPLPTATDHRADLLQALRQPASALALSLRGWEDLVRLARHAAVLGRLAAALEAGGLLDQVPAAPRAHLEATMLLARAQHAEVRRECAYIHQALAHLDEPPVLLKGAAYVMAGLPAAAGRLFSDIDILVPHAQLAAVEIGLGRFGWITTHHDAYDQRYYREWMHELPPLEHSVRGTVIDAHHTILPLTARLQPPVQRLFEQALPVEGGFRILAPADMVLHSIVHLFHNEELSHGLRDLSDIDLLLRHFSRSETDWVALVDRGRELGLQRPLWYGLHSVARILGTPVPPQVLRRAAGGSPGRAMSTLMDALWWRALRPQHPMAAPAGTSVALFLLYLRAHWLRMPPLLLARHLSIKAWRRLRADDNHAAGAAAP